MKKLSFISLTALVALAACSEAPTSPAGEIPALSEIVITAGVQAPPRAPGRPLFSTLEDARVNVGGSTTTALSLPGASCAPEAPRSVTISYTMSGNQRSDASFKVHTSWDYDGSEFVGTNPTTVVVAAKQGGGTATYSVAITVANSSGLGSGETHFVVSPFDLQTNPSDPPGQQLSLDASSSATVYVTFNDCTPEAPINTRPSLTMPADMTVEATSSAGAAVTFVVTANDTEDGDLTSSVVCTPESGSSFPFGETTVNCVVTDSGGLSAEGSFKVTVVDTTAPVFTSFPGSQTLIAANINGAVLDLESLGITAEDQGPNGEPGDISPDVSWACDYPAGAWLAIGSTTTVACTATDGRGNESDRSYFDVFVTLDLSAMTGFEQPLRMSAPFSAHKAGSTIPHKFGAPRYADGTPATDLASGLRLTLTKQSGGEEYEQETMDEYGAGSTAWRYSPAHYIFNLKTEKGWGAGDWTTTVSYAGIPLASTTFTMRN
jgi:hypothetical protein